MTITPNQKIQMLDTLRAALQIVEAIPATTACETCDNWSGEMCSHWDAVPPTEIQQKGCEEWIDAIPF